MGLVMICHRNLNPLKLLGDDMQMIFMGQCETKLYNFNFKDCFQLLQSRNIQMDYNVKLMHFKRVDRLQPFLIRLC